jgi:hypothetical protein
MLLTGCRSASAIFIDQKDRELLIVPDGDKSLSIMIATPTHIDLEQGSINTSLSYAVDEQGKKYKFIIDFNEWARKNYKNASRRTPPDRFWLTDYNSPGKKLGWWHGSWKVVLVLDTKQDSKTYIRTFEFSNLWAPLFSPPN